MTIDFIETVEMGDKVRKYSDGKTIYPDHDPFCIIYKTGPGHCNCVDTTDDNWPIPPAIEGEEGWPTDDYDDEEYFHDDFDRMCEAEDSC